MAALFIFVAKYFYLLSLAALGAHFLLQRREAQKRMALFAIPAALLAYVLSALASHLYFDPRPFVVGHFAPLVPHAPDNGFPSDHTLLVSAIAAIGSFWSRRLGLLLWILAALVAAARVYVGVHHTIDVIGSIVIASSAIALTRAAFKRMHKEIA